MLRMPDRWIYVIEKANGDVVMADDATDWRYQINKWHWDTAYQSIDTLRTMYTRGEAVDMVFNKNYIFVKYLATQYYTWDDGTVTFIKKSVLKKEIMTLDEIWDRPTQNNNCDECYGSCEQCVYRKLETAINQYGNLIVINIKCLYSDDDMHQSLAKGNHYCSNFICLQKLLEDKRVKC